MISGVSAFLWQAALMLLAAYFLGAFIGCWLRRRISQPPKVAMESDAGATTVAAAAGATAAASVLAAAVETETEQAAVAPENTKNLRPTDETNNGAMGDAAARVAAATPEPTALSVDSATSSSPPKAPGAQTGGDQPKQFTPPMSAAAAAAAALAARQAANAANQKSSTDAVAVAAGSPASTLEKLATINPPAAVIVPDLPAATGSSGQAVVAAPVSQSDATPSIQPDDLMLIKGITASDAKSLVDAGFATFAAIAAWTAADVAATEPVVGDRRISRENWIEQAQLLQSGIDTTFSRRSQPALAARPDAVSVAPVAPAEAVTSAPNTPSPSHGGGADEGSDETNDAAVVAAAVAAATVATAALAPVAARAPTNDAATTSGYEASGQKPEVSDRAAFSRERRGYADDLQQIDGINAEVEKLLNEQGVTRIAQIAGWPDEEQKRIDRLLGGMNRVAREDWVGQARRISGFATPSQETDFDPDLTSDLRISTDDDALVADAPTSTAESNAADAPAEPVTGAPTPEAERFANQEPPSSVLPLGNVAPPASAMRGLRSVRSEALIGANTVDADGNHDDLKHIRGVGALIEKRLRSMGYTSYAQIGSWTQSDVDRVNQQLDFRGRIERENWIEQARILAAGGQTDFSRRQERDDT